MNPVNTLSWRFGRLIGAMWMGLMLLGNLGGTSLDVYANCTQASIP